MERIINKVYITYKLIRKPHMPPLIDGMAPSSCIAILLLANTEISKYIDMCVSNLSSFNYSYLKLKLSS